jgi:DNA-binding MarR family transcriptional regulator
MTPSIYDYLERLANLLRTDSRRSGAAFGLQPVQLEALHYLSICNRYSDTPMAVTDYLGQTKGTVSQTLKVLESKGLIEKSIDPDDRRMMHLSLTASGRKILGQSIPPPQLVKACGQLDRQDHDAIIDALRTLLHTLQQANSLKSFGVCETCRYNQAKGNSYHCGLTGEALSKQDIGLICREHENAA